MIDQGSRIENIWHIYHFSRECYNVARYFENPSTPEEQKAYNLDRSLSFVQHLFFRTAIIELNKLTHKSGNDFYNIHKYLGKLKAEEHDFSNDLIGDWEEKLEKHKGIIETINTLRIKFYAHSDKDRYEHLSEINSITNTGINDLYSIIREIILKTYEFNAGTADLDDFEFRNGDIGILRNYAELHQLKIDVLANKNY